MRGLKIPDSHKMPEGLEGVKEVFSTLYSFAALHFNGSVTVWGDVTRGGCNGESPKKTYYTCFPKDAQALEACESIYGPRDDMHYCATKEQALDDADCLVICTE